MKFKKLGTTDIDVSLICLGTMTWGTQNTEKDAFEQMDYAVSQGINFFDTAEIYSVPPTSDSYGKTEMMIGNWFEKRKNRDKIILASKVAGPGCDWIRGGGNNFISIFSFFEPIANNHFCFPVRVRSWWHRVNFCSIKKIYSLRYRIVHLLKSIFFSILSAPCHCSEAN